MEEAKMKLLLLKNAKVVDGAPAEFQLFPYGNIRIEGEQDAILDEESMGSIIAGFERRGNDMVIDYEHQTLMGTQAPAAGWIKRLINKGKEGLWAVVEWTEQAREYLAKKEYRYFSPVFWTRNKDRKIVGIQNVALTNDPLLNNLRPIVAKMTLDEARNEQEQRAKKYNIGIKEGGHVTKPSEWEGVEDDQFLDPVNYRYPCPDADQARAAASYWGQAKNQEQYTQGERSIINERLEKN
jgi:phage I-like protein